MTPEKIYQLRIGLKDISPPIWRRVQVEGKTTLDELHEIVQIVMGWENSHLHNFEIDEVYYTDPIMLEFNDWREDKDSTRYKLKDVIREEGKTFYYTYDYGDSWLHAIKVEKILPKEAGGVYPLCVKGKRACPPEDVGGYPGYYYFVEAMQDKSHPSHNDFKWWWGDEVYDPEAFDLEAVNRDLAERFHSRQP